jgi:aspartate/methionine/tyrosine aminotransferase
VTVSPLPIAERIGRLGTETAFAVSAEAAVWQGEGHTVYPFHLGDMDLATPENIIETAFRALRERKNGYCPNAASSSTPSARMKKASAE